MEAALASNLHADTDSLRGDGGESSECKEGARAKQEPAKVAIDLNSKVAQARFLRTLDRPALGRRVALYGEPQRSVFFESDSSTFFWCVPSCKTTL